MTNVKLLNSLIEESGMTKVFIADKMGVSRPRLYKILEGAECTVSEMMSLSNVLRLTNKQRSDVFLCK
jgi:predicted transcriptional regulator